MNSSDQDGSLQNPKKGTERVQTKLGKTHVDYWRSKLRKRSFVGRDGNPAEVPDWQVRIKHQGRYAWFNLKSANAAIAADLAKEIYVFLIANGWEATLEKYKPQVEKRANLKVQEFADLYREQIELVEYPPIPRTINRYVGCLFLICKFMGIKRIARLTADKISAFRRKYLKKALEKKRDETSAKITCNSQMRGAAALFSEEMIKAYKAVGVDVINPFTGYQFGRIEIQPYTPLPREFLDGLWRDSAKLRDGDPDAPPPPKRQRRKRRKPVHGRRLRPLKRTDVRWTVPDWRRPHPESYTLMLLELGVGLRREEADKAEWSWFFTDKDGRHYIEVKKTKYFTPKGKKRRIIPVENVLWDAIHATRSDDSPFIVPGNVPKVYTRQTEPKNVPYRCEPDHRTLVAWLRKRGINDSKPCHMLRKEFGSYVATSFGIFAAQRLLGHSSPAVTEALYAGLVNLPELRHAQPPPAAQAAP
jgi:integrase